MIWLLSPGEIFMETVASRNRFVTPAREGPLKNVSVEAVTSRFVNLWLCLLAALLAGSLVCIAVLVAWPSVANLAAGI